MPRSNVNALVKQILLKFERVLLVQRFREMEVCAESCMNAQALICECSCQMKNHGIGHGGDGWIHIHEGFAFRFGKETLSCNFLTYGEYRNRLRALEERKSNRLRCDGG